MSRALLFTRLKVVDPAAVTALETLRHRFDQVDQLAGLAREEFFLFDVEAPAPTTRDRIERLVRGTNLLLNPNKHVWRLVVEHDDSAPVAPGAPAEAYLLVWTPGDGADLLTSIQRHGLADDMVGLARGWLWRFTAAPGVDAPTLRAMVQQAGPLRSRERGFLVHPAYQEHRVYARRPTLYDIGEFVTFDATLRSSGENP